MNKGKRKTLFSVVVTMLVALFAATGLFVLGGCDISLNKKPAEETCDHTFKSEWSYDEQSHWHDATCGHDVKGDKAAHTWDEGEITAQATCLADGEKTFTCSCGATRKEPIAQLSHSWDEGEITTTATCTVDGVKTYTCKNGCGETKTEKIAKLGHSWNEGEITTVATCTVDGVKTYTCKNGCGETKKESLAKLGHSWDNGEITTVATCTTNGVKTYTCTHDCGETKTEEITRLGHSWNDGEITTAATCKAEGVKTYTCENDCGETKTESIAKVAHTWVKSDVPATCTTVGYHLEKCSVCQKEDRTNEIAALDHAWSTATCTKASICSRCQTTGEPALGHEYEVTETKAATCTEAQRITYTCSHGCGDSYSETTGEPNGHDIVWTQQETNTATADVCYTVVSVGACKNCDHTETGAEEKVKEHLLGSVITTVATCTTDGVKTYTCSKCAYHYTENYKDGEAHAWNDGVLAGNVTTYTCAHNAVHTKTAVVAQGTTATVSAQDMKTAGSVELESASIKLDDNAQKVLEGKNEIVIGAEALQDAALDEAIKDLSATDSGVLEGATVYNFTMEVDGVPVTNFGGKVTVRIPYTLEEGEDPDHITVWYINGDKMEEVEARYSDGYAVFETEHFSYYTVTRLTPAQRCAKYGHINQNFHKDATCLISGYDYTVCTRCGLKSEQTEIKASGHKWVGENKQPTCTESVSVTYTCSVCDESYSVTLPALGHEWQLTEETAATCNTEGGRSYKCAKCGETYEVTIPQLMHDFAETVIASTCTEEGYTKKTCSACGEEIFTAYRSALGHDYEPTVLEPTCTEAGKTVHSCTRCDDSYESDAMPALGHSATEIRQEPTCTEEGKVSHVCGRCQEKLAEDETLEALGHDMQDGVCTRCGVGCEHVWVKGDVVLATCLADGYTEYTCSECSRIEKRDIVVALGHDYEKGVCTRCGDVCEHVWVKGTPVPASCTEGGYTEYTCSNCSVSERRDTVAALGHNYENGVCTRCGDKQQGEEQNAYYTNIIKSLRNTHFALRITDFRLEQIEKDIVTNESTTMMKLSAVDVIELSVFLKKDGTLTGAGNAVVTCETEMNGTMVSFGIDCKLYIDGETLYLIAKPENREMSTQYMMLGLDYVLCSAFGEGMDYATFRSIVSLLNDDAEKIVDSVLNANSAFTNKVLASVLDKLFTKETKDGNITYTLHPLGIAVIKDQMKTLKASAFVDYLLGENTFAGLENTINRTLDLTLNAFVDELAKYGLNKAEICAFVDKVMAASGSEVPEGGSAAMLDQALVDMNGNVTTVAEFIVMMINSNAAGNNKPVDPDTPVTPDKPVDPVIPDKPVEQPTQPEKAVQPYAGEGGAEQGGEAQFTVEMLKEQISSMFAMVKEYTVFEILAQASGADENAFVEQVEAFVTQFVETIDTLAAVSFTTDANGNILALDVSLNEISMVVGGERNPGKVEEDGTVVEAGGGTDYILKFSGKFAVTMNDDVTVNAEAIISEIKSTLPHYEANQIVTVYQNRTQSDENEFGLIEQEEGVEIRIHTDDKGNVIQIVKETQSVHLNIMMRDDTGRLDYEEIASTRIVTMVMTTPTFMIETGYCGDWNLYTSYGEYFVEESETRTYHSMHMTENGLVEENSHESGSFNNLYGGNGSYIDLYYNVSTGEYSAESPHSYKKDEEHSNHVCNGYDTYTCEICGDSYQSKLWHLGEMTESVRLQDGATTCEDGIIVTYVCSVCHESEKAYTEYYHREYEREVHKLTEYGSVCGGQLIVRGCACGEHTYVNFEGACDFNDSMYYEDEALRQDPNVVIDYSQIHKCVTTDPLCRFAYVEQRYYVNGENCKATEYSRFIFGTMDGDTFVPAENGTFTYSRGETYNHQWDYNSNEELDSEGRVTRRTSENTCVNCGRKSNESVETFTYDAEGNYATKEYSNTHFNDKGEVENSEQRSYIYVQGHEIITFERDEKEGYWYQSIYEYVDGKYCMPTVTSTSFDNEKGSTSVEDRHYEYEWYMTRVSPSTCTQSGVSACMLCAQTITSHPTRHNQQYTNGRYVCDNCGLESENPLNGEIMLEDLSSCEERNYGVGFYCDKGEMLKEGYMVTVALISPADETVEIFVEDELGVELPAMDKFGSGKFVFPVAKITELAATHNLTVYAVRVTFVPIGWTGTRDYSITFGYSESTKNDHNWTLDEANSNIVCSGGYKYYTCSVCGMVGPDPIIGHLSVAYDAVLKDGATSCEEGVIVTSRCTVCGEVFETQEYTNHYSVEKEFDFAEMGSVCGAKLSVYTCCCGKNVSQHVTSECKFRITREDNPNDGNTWYDRLVYCCTECGFAYRYEKFGTVDENCNEAITYLYTFGTVDENGAFTPNGEHSSISFNQKRTGAHDATLVESEPVLDEHNNPISQTIRRVCSRCQKELSVMEITIEYSYKEDGTLLAYTCFTVNSENGAITSEYEDRLMIVNEHEIPIRHEERNGDDWTREEYQYDGNNYCHVTVIRTDCYGNTETMTREEHLGEMVATYQFFDEALGCEGGGNRLFVCSFCNQPQDGVVAETFYGHEMFMASNMIKLSEFGSVCGGEFVYDACPCGKRVLSHYLNTVCNFEVQEIEARVEGNISYEQGWYYICKTCNFAYKNYSCSIKSGENCLTTYYMVYEFGTIDTTTGEFVLAKDGKFEFENGTFNQHTSTVGTDGTKHDEHGNLTEGIVTYVCSDCGAELSRKVYNNTYTYDENGVLVAKNIDERDEAAEGSLINAKLEEYKYVNGQEIPLLIRVEKQGYWHQTEYRYEGEKYCVWTAIFTESNNSDIKEDYREKHKYTVVGRTCASWGTSVCAFCGMENPESVMQEELLPLGHDMPKESADGTYTCARCGAIATNGEFTFEAIAESESDIYTIAYYTLGEFSSVEPTFTVSLVTENGEQDITAQITLTKTPIEKEGFEAGTYTISKAAVTALAQNLQGYTLKVVVSAALPYGGTQVTTLTF